jgi:polar amino acid transport system substrate-binding protein
MASARLRSCLGALAGLAFLALVGGASAGEVPEAIRQSGTLHLSVNAIYPPMEYKDPANDSLIGLDIDLANAIAGKLGLKIVWQESAFEQLVPSLTTGRTDFIISGLSDLPARRETMNFIDYMRSGAQFYTLAGSPAKTQADLCGKRVGTSRSTSFPNEIRRWSAENCESAGRPAIELVNAESTADARGQLRQGRVDAAVQGSETIPYIMSLEPGTYRALGTPFSTVYQGIAFRKADTAFRDAVADVLAGLIADGTYGRIMAKWNLPGNAMDAPLFNAEPRR